MITAERCYDNNPDFSNYYQGDVLSDIPFPTLPTLLPAARQGAWGLLRPRPRPADQRPVDEVMRQFPVHLIGRAAGDLPDAWARQEAAGEYVIAHCKKTTVALISRSCDIDKDSRKHLLVAPVVDMRDLPIAQRTDEKLRGLRENEIFHWFYLPEKPPNLPESYADLSLMVPMHRSFFDEESLRAHLVARLSGEGTHAFQNMLSTYYGVQFGFSPSDACPQTARYACSACFHSGQATPYSRNFNAGEVFGDCGHCREQGAWVKMP